MKRKAPFFVGWSGELPEAQRSIIRKWLIGIFLFIPVLSYLLVTAQKPFNNHIFNFGNVTLHSGIYHAQPVPILEVTDGSLPDSVSKSVLLVGFGKFGAEGIMSEIEKQEGSLDKQQITLQGTLIYGDGKAVLELTKKEQSLIEISLQPNSSLSIAASSVSETRSGELLDPKCYFGVMKPGEGKIHKSCAIRCISGGIPPVFRSVNASGKYEYSIVLGLQGQKINKEILTYVGEQVAMTGEWTEKHGWGVVYVDPGSIRNIEG